MKSMRFALSIAVLFLATAALAQSDAKKSFDQLKTLAGSWDAAIQTIPPQPDIQGQKAHVTLRVTSMGNVLTHEITSSARPDDPITMLYLDDGRLTLTHYCDAGNRPRMTGKMSADGKSVDFDFLDVAGDTHYGHMHHAKFTFVDADHHVEDWTFMVGDKPVQAHFELQRSK